MFLYWCLGQKYAVSMLCDEYWEHQELEAGCTLYKLESEGLKEKEVAFSLAVFVVLLTGIFIPCNSEIVCC